MVLGSHMTDEQKARCSAAQKERVVYIPKVLHRSISHNVFTGWNMAEINALALPWIPASDYDLIPREVK